MRDMYHSCAYAHTTLAGSGPPVQASASASGGKLHPRLYTDADVAIESICVTATRAPASGPRYKE